MNTLSCDTLGLAEFWRNDKMAIAQISTPGSTIFTLLQRESGKRSLAKKKRDEERDKNVTNE